LLDRDYARQIISSDVPAGYRTNTTIWLTAPATPGAYFLKVDLVSEGVTWFESRGSAPALQRLKVGETGSQL
jgi:hypothetical protein